MKHYRPTTELIIGLLIIIGVSILVSGCGTVATFADSLNLQRSALRGSGDVGATAYLDLNNSANPDKMKVSAEQMLKFFQTGDVSVFSLNAIKTKLEAIVSAEYVEWVDIALMIVGSQQLNVGQAIGKDNVKRIIAYLTGISTGATKFER